MLGVNEPRFSNCFIEKRGSLYDPALGRHYHKDIAEKLSSANFTYVTLVRASERDGEVVECADGDIYA